VARKQSSRQSSSSSSSSSGGGAGGRARREKRGAPGTGRRKSCPYCRDKVDVVDYKDFGGVRRQLSEKGKIRSARVTGCCRRHQRQLARAVKRARELGLLPYVSDR
jgi:small subunit ribosomal protein S18